MRQILALLLCCVASIAEAQQIFNNPGGSLFGQSGNQGTAGLPTGTNVTSRSNDGNTSAFTADAIGTGLSGAFYARHARGTSGSPTATQSGDVIGVLGSFGYGATGYSSSSRATIGLTAGENWTDSAQGAYVSIFSTPLGTVTPVERMRIGPSNLWQAFGSTSGTISFQPQGAAGTYNWNWPTSAGTSGQPLLSGGGGSTAMTFGTLGVGAGGTGSATTFTTGSVVFAGASGVYSQDNANFFWDDTNNRVGIGTAIPDAPLTISGNNGATVAPGDTTYIHIIGADGTTTPQIVMDGFGGAVSVPVMRARKASGTRASPTGVLAGEQMFAFAPQGYDGSAYQNGPSINFYVAQNWSGSARGSRIAMSTIATGATALAETFSLFGSGGLAIGSASTGTDPGANVIAASALQSTNATTVAGLPTCNAAARGQRRMVTDANATTFHTTAAGGGGNVMGVTCDGTNWYLS